MLYEFGDDWIETKEFEEISVKEKSLINSKNYTSFLKSFIIAWSEKREITLKSIRSLKSNVVAAIIDDVNEEIIKFGKIIERNLELENIYNMHYSSRINVPEETKENDREFWDYIEKYLEYMHITYFDHHGNIIKFPKTGAIEDQSYQYIELVKIAQRALRNSIKNAK